MYHKEDMSMKYFNNSKQTKLFVGIVVGIIILLIPTVWGITTISKLQRENENLKWLRDELDYQVKLLVSEKKEPLKYEVRNFSVAIQDGKDYITYEYYDNDKWHAVTEPLDREHSQPGLYFEPVENSNPQYMQMAPDGKTFVIDCLSKEKPIWG